MPPRSFSSFGGDYSRLVSVFAGTFLVVGEEGGLSGARTAFGASFSLPLAPAKAR